jgi:hypothetical protein
VANEGECCAVAITDVPLRAPLVHERTAGQRDVAALEPSEARVLFGSAAPPAGQRAMSRRTSVMGRRASVRGIAEMNDFARLTVVEATLKQNGGSCA